MPEFLARVHVGHVHFHHGRLHGGDGVAQRIAVMGERARVEHDAVRIRLLDLGAQLAFDIALEELARSLQKRSICALMSSSVSVPYTPFSRRPVMFRLTPFKINNFISASVYFKLCLA